VPSDRIRGNQHNLKHRRFPLNMMKLYFTVTVTENWYMLPSEVAESPSFEIFKSLALGNWL